MGNGMLALLTRLKEQSDKSRSYNEDQAKQGIVLPILRQLGWDTEDVEEVHPEFSVEQRKVDYALVLEGRPAVFIEAKDRAKIWTMRVTRSNYSTTHFAKRLTLPS